MSMTGRKKKKEEKKREKKKEKEGLLGRHLNSRRRVLGPLCDQVKSSEPVRVGSAPGGGCPAPRERGLGAAVLGASPDGAGGSVRPLRPRPPPRPPRSAPRPGADSDG